MKKRNVLILGQVLRVSDTAGKADPYIPNEGRLGLDRDNLLDVSLLDSFETDDLSLGKMPSSRAPKQYRLEHLHGKTKFWDELAVLINEKLLICPKTFLEFLNPIFQLGSIPPVEPDIPEPRSRHHEDDVPA